jgi:serine/threonine protein kinase
VTGGTASGVSTADVARGRGGRRGALFSAVSPLGRPYIVDKSATSVTGLALPGIENLQRIGRGGFASVYRGWQPAFHRDVAIKILDPIPGNPSEPRFRRELKAMGSLSDHPHVVAVYEAGVIEDRPYLVMPLLTGGSLADQLERGPLSAAEVVRLGLALTDALAAAHKAGLLHRDVKPANILSTAYGQPQLADFGIARFADSTVTQGQVAATISYAAPEVLEGEPASPASDVYALGATLYTALRGKPPFTSRPGEPPVGFAMRIMREAPPDLRAAGVPESLAAVIERAMAKDPGERYDSAIGFKNALQSVDLAFNPDTDRDTDANPGDATIAAAALPSVPDILPAAPVPARVQRPEPVAAAAQRPLPPLPLNPDPRGERSAPVVTRTSNQPRRALLTATAVVTLVLVGALVALLVAHRPRAATASHISGIAAPPATAATTASPAPPAKPSVAPRQITVQPPAQPTVETPAQATVAYYGIVSQHNLNAAFSLLSPAYQQRTGFGTYRGFWNTIARVDVLKATSVNDTATALLRYTRTDGTTSTETARLRFVTDPHTGKLLIDGYTP